MAGLAAVAAAVTGGVAVAGSCAAGSTAGMGAGSFLWRIKRELVLILQMNFISLICI